MRSYMGKPDKLRGSRGTFSPTCFSHSALSPALTGSSYLLRKTEWAHLYLLREWNLDFGDFPGFSAWQDREENIKALDI